MALFEPLFELKIKHSYYRDDLSVDFKAVPADDTRAKLRNHGLLFRSAPSGFTVLAEADDSAPGGLSVRRLPDEPERYRFYLIQKRSQLLNYTDLPFHQPTRTIYYFNNLNSNIADGSKLLHPSSDAVTAADQLPLEKGTYRYTATGTGQQKTARLVFTDLDIEEEQEARSREGVFEFQFDLSGYPDGRAELWVDGTPKETFYAVNRRNMASIFGVVELFHSQSVPAVYRFLESDGTLNTQRYELAFKKRSTYWKYIVINRSGSDLDDPGIEHSDGTYTFRQDSSGTYPDNYSVFVSDQEIPLSQDGIASFSLRKKFSSANRLVLDSLPNPGSEILKRDGADSSKYYSEVFLYI